MAWKGHGKSFEFIVYSVHEIPPEDEENTPYVGDEGTLVRVDMGENVSGWSNCVFKILKQDDSTANWTATPNGTYLEYTIVTDDFSVAGKYVCTPYGEAP
jgi:hypothetical protein